MRVTDYTTKIKEICDALESINVIVDKDKMVQICLGGLEVRADPDNSLHKGEAIVVFRPAINAYCQGKPHRCIKKHTIR